MQPIPALAGGTASHPITVDSSAAAHHKATIKTTTAGVPQVDIVAPNAAGISHNRFTDFNVSPVGTVLNNGTDVGVAIVGGAVDRNHNLQTGGEASAILLEVTSSNRSALDGYTEVVGQPADVIVANPNGITCKGCGFIGTPNVELTTRSADGVVHGGNIVVEAGANGGLGLDARLSESLRLNAGKVAVDAPVLAGKVLTIEATGAGLADGEQFAIDASELGAMSAGKIQLIATNEGFGVRSRADVIGASDDIAIIGGQIVLGGTVAAARDVVVEAAERLEKTGAVVAGRDVVMNGQTLESEGGYYAGRDLDLSAEGDLTLKRRQNVPLPPDIPALSAQSGQTASEDSPPGPSSQDLAEAESPVVPDEEGSASADGNLDNAILAERVMLKAGGRLVNELDIIAGTDLVLEGEESIFNSQNVLFAGQTLAATSTGLIDNDGSSWHGEQQVIMNAPAVVQRGGSLLAAGEAGQFDLTGVTRTFTNTGGSVLVAEQELSLDITGVFNNQGGAVMGSERLAITAGGIINDEGTIVALDTLTLGSHGDISNLFGSVESEGALALNAGNNIISLGGHISGLDGVTVDAGGRLDIIESALNAGSITVDEEGHEYLAGRLQLTADGDINLSGSSIFALGSALVRGQTITADSSSFAGSLVLELQSSEGSVILSNSTVEVANWLVNSAGDALVYGSGIATTGDWGIGAEEILLSDSTLLAGGHGLLAGDAHTAILGSIVEAAESLAIQSQQESSVTGSILQAGTGLLMQAEEGITIDASSVLQAVNMELRSTQVLNQDGTLLADGSVLIAAEDVRNTGDIISRHTSIAAATFDNSGALLSDALQAVTSHALINTSLIYTSELLELLSDGSFTNTDGGIAQSESTVVLRAGDRVINNGLLLAGDDLHIEVGENFYTGQGSETTAGKNLSLHTTGSFIHSGTLRSDEDAWIRTDGQTWGSGLIDVAGNLAYTTPGRFDWYENKADEAGIRIVNASSAEGRKPLFDVGGDWLVEADSFGLYTDYAFGGNVLLNGGSLFIHHGSQVTVAGDFDARLTDRLHTTNGTVQTDGNLTIVTAGDVDHGAALTSSKSLALVHEGAGTVNLHGVLEAGEDLLLESRGTLINRPSSQIRVGGDIFIEIDGDVQHQAGALITAGGDLSFHTRSNLINDGLIRSNNNAWITTGQKIWGGGVLESAGDMTIRTSGAFNIISSEDGGFRFVNGSPDNGQQNLVKTGGDLYVVADNFRIDTDYNFDGNVKLAGKTLGTYGDVTVDGNFIGRFRDRVIITDAFTTTGDFIVNDGSDDGESQLILTSHAPITVDGTFNFDGLTFDNRSEIVSTAMQIRAGKNSWHNSGHLKVAGDYTLITTGLAENTGFLDVTGDIYIEADQIINRGVYNRPSVTPADVLPSLQTRGTVNVHILFDEDDTPIWTEVNGIYFRYSDLAAVLEAGGVDVSQTRHRTVEHNGQTPIKLTYLPINMSALYDDIAALDQYIRIHELKNFAGVIAGGTYHRKTASPWQKLPLDFDLWAQALDIHVKHYAHMDYVGDGSFDPVMSRGECLSCIKQNLDLLSIKDANALLTEQARRDTGVLDERVANSGMIKGQNITLISGSTIENLAAGQIVAAENLTLQAEDNIISEGAKRFTGNEEWNASFVFDSAAIIAETGNLTLNSQTRHFIASGSDISAGNDMLINVADSIRMEALIDSYATDLAGLGRVPVELANGDIVARAQLSHENILAPTRLAAGNALVMNAGTGHIFLSGSQLNAGDVVLNAGRNFHNWGQAYGAQNGRMATEWLESSITGSRDVLVTAGGNLYNAASTIHAGQMVDLHAGENVKHQSTLEAFTNRYYVHKRYSGHTYDHTWQQAYILAGTDVNISAGSNIFQEGGQIEAERDINLLAGGDIDLSSITNRQTSNQYHRNKGIFKSSSETSAWTVSKTILPEQTAGRDITLSAHQDITAIGAQLRAGRNINLNAGGNIHFAPEQVDHYKWTEIKTQGFRLFGIFGALVDVAEGNKSIGGAIVDSIPLASAIDEALNTQSATDLAPLVNLGVELANNWTSLRALSQGDFSQGGQDFAEDQLGVEFTGSGIPIPSKFGFYSSKIYTREDWTESYNSTLNAGQHINATANDSIILTGTRLLAERDIRLSAVNDIVIEAVEESYKNVYEQESKGFSLGIGLDSGGDLSSVSVAFDRSWHNSNGSGIAYNPSSIESGGDIIIDAGGDIDVIGSQITGDTVSIAAGDRLNVVTVQDIYTSRTRGGSFSFGVSIGQGGITPNGSFSYLKGSKDYRWSNATAQIIGRSAVTINSPALNLIGSLIANLDEEGVDQGNLEINANEITHSNLYDYDKSKLLSFGIALGGAVNIAPGGGVRLNDGAAIPGVAHFLKKKDVKTGETRATIGSGVINTASDISELNRNITDFQIAFKDDKDTISAALPIFSAQTYIDAANDVRRSISSSEASDKIVEGQEQLEESARLMESDPHAAGEAYAKGVALINEGVSLLDEDPPLLTSSEQSALQPLINTLQTSGFNGAGEAQYNSLSNEEKSWVLFQLGTVSGPVQPQGLLPIVPALIAGGKAAITGCAASVACAAFVGGALGTSVGLTAVGEGSLVDGANSYNQNIANIGQYIAVKYPEETKTVQYVASLPGQGFSYALDTVGGDGTSEAFNQNVEAFDQWLHSIGYTGDVRAVANAFATNMSLGGVTTGGVALAGNVAKRIRVGNQGYGSYNLGKTTGEFTLYNPGVLPDRLSDTFIGGRYKEIVLKEDTIFHRVGTSERPLGEFFSIKSPQGVLQSRIDKAILPKWPEGGISPIDSSITVKVPKGTKVYVGHARSQGDIYVGGTEQIIIQKSWEIDGIEVLNITPIR